MVRSSPVHCGALPHLMRCYIVWGSPHTQASVGGIFLVFKDTLQRPLLTCRWFSAVPSVSSNTFRTQEPRFPLGTTFCNSKWGAHPSPLHTSALALCFSTAKYACQEWLKSSHACKLGPILNETCRVVTGCIKTTPLRCLYALSGIAPPDIHRAVIAKAEHTGQ